MRRSRRLMLVALCAAGVTWALGLLAEEAKVPMNKLNAGMSVGEVTAILEGTLLGLEVSELPAAIESLDGKVVAIQDIAESEIATGTRLGEGVHSGDPVLSVMIGLSRGFFRADEIVGAYAWYEDGKITRLSEVGVRRK